MENENLVTEGQENVVDSQTEVKPTESENTEVAAVQEDKPKQDPDTNAMFAKVRRESEAKAKDAIIAEMYGKSHGINTYEEYKKAIKEQEEIKKDTKLKEETGIDPNSLKPIFERWKETDPDFQELKAIRAEKNTSQALIDLNAELKDAGLDLQIKDLSTPEMTKIPNIEKVTEYVEKGHTLADAFFLANKKTIIANQTKSAQQEAISKIAGNAESSPGSLAGGDGQSDFISFEQFEKNKHDQRWVINNLSKITKSRQKW